MATRPPAMAPLTTAPLTPLAASSIRRDPSDAPTAGNGIFINVGGPASGIGGGFVVFHFGTAGDATVINDGATVSDGIEGETLFRTGDAGNAIADRQRRCERR